MDVAKRNKNREYFLDILRVAATCAVVLLHTVTGVMDATDMSVFPTEKKVFLVLLDLITWCVPLFVLISGYLFLNPAREIPFRKMIFKYCRRILLALLLFGIPYACMELVMTEHTFRIGMLGEAFWMVCKGESWSHMWYLYMILLLYFLTPALKWILARVPKTVVYVILAGLLLGSSILPFLKKLLDLEMLPVLPDGGIYFFYYICGYLFACGKGTPKACARSRRVVLGSILLIFGGMICSRLVGDYSVQMAYNYPFTVVISLLLMWLARSAEPSFAGKKMQWFRTMGERSFAVYLIHPVFLNLLYKGMHVSLLDFPIGISLPFVFLAVLLLAWGTAWVLYRIPLLKKYVL